MQPDILVSDAERDHALDRLREACTDGRLTLAEFSERVDHALTARTHADLVPVTAGLEEAGPRPREGRVRSATRRVAAVMGSTKQRGRWRAAEHIEASAIMGECHLDLRQAEVQGDVIEIDATVVMGQIKIIVPAGVEVEMDGWAVMGTRSHDDDEGWSSRVRRLFSGEVQDAAEVALRPGGPLVRVNARVLMGELKVEHVS
jgi:hypothetical protein